MQFKHKWALYTYTYTHLHIYICTYVHAYIRRHLHRYIYIYICIHIYTCIHVYMYTNIHIFICTYRHTSAGMHIHKYICTYVFTCIYMYTHIHTCICIYIYVCTHATLLAILSFWVRVLFDWRLLVAFLFLPLVWRFLLSARQIRQQSSIKNVGSFGLATKARQRVPSQSHRFKVWAPNLGSQPCVHCFWWGWRSMGRPLFGIWYILGI